MTCSFAELSTWSDIYRIRKAQFPILRLFLRLMGKLFTRCIASTRRVVFVSRQFPTEWARVTMNLRPKISWMRMGSKLSHSTHLADITWHSLLKKESFRRPPTRIVWIRNYEVFIWIWCPLSTMKSVFPKRRRAENPFKPQGKDSMPLAAFHLPQVCHLFSFIF